MPVRVAHFADSWDKEPIYAEAEPEVFLDALTVFPVVDAADSLPDPTEGKRHLPAWSPASFLPGTRAKNENVTELSCVVLDYDDGTDPEEVSEVWAGVAHVAYSTYTSQPNHPKFRLVVPLERPVSVRWWQHVWHHAAEASPGEPDPQCKNPGRVFFLPARGRFEDPWFLLNPGPLWSLEPSELPEPPSQGTRWDPTAPVPDATRLSDRQRRRALRRWRDRLEDQTQPIETMTDGRRAAIQRTTYLLAGHLWLDPSLPGELMARMQAVAVACGRDTPNTEQLVQDTVVAGQSAPLALEDLIQDEAPASVANPAAGPLLVKYGKNAYVRDAGGSYQATDPVGVALHLRDRGDVRYQTAAGNPMPFPALLDRYGVEARSVEYVFEDEHTGWDQETSTLRVMDGVRYETEPVHSPEIERWLNEALRGNSAGVRDLFLDWLATLSRLNKPTAGMYIRGSRGTGKSMLASAIGGMWSDAPISLGDACGKYGKGLTRNPLVLLDEGEKPEYSAISTASLRKLISESAFQVGEKFKSDVTLRSCLRMLIVANNDNALLLDDIHSMDDLDAIAARLFYVVFGKAAEMYLRSLGGRPYTEAQGWVNGERNRPGRIAQHIAWLRENRPVKPPAGNRLLIEGRMVDFHRDLVLRSPVTSMVAEAVLLALVKRGTRTPAATWDKSGHVAVNAGKLLDAWTAYGQGALRPSLRVIAKTLDILSRNRGPGQVWYVDGDLIKSLGRTVGLPTDVPVDVPDAKQVRFKPKGGQ